MNHAKRDKDSDRARDLQRAVIEHIKATGYCDQHDEGLDEIEGPDAGLCSETGCTYCALVRAEQRFDDAKETAP